jgi:uncharacterized protein
MNRITRLFICAVFASALASICSAQDAAAFACGRWTGEVSLPSSGAGASSDAAAERESFGIRLFPASPEAGSPLGGLLDMPSRGLFGFPLGDVRRDTGRLAFSLRGKAPFDGLFELEASPGSANGASLSGTMRILSAPGVSGGEGEVLAEGPFTLALESGSSRALEYGLDYSIDTGRGLLPGSLLVPDSAERPPVVLLLSGAQADRDGNNYAVPGKSDSLLRLALSLRGRGVSTLRFDKRGTGESYALVADESALVFDDHVEDARAALRALAADGRFSSVTVVGFAEGALVGACALDDSPKDARVSGIVALCASGRTEVELVEEVLSGAPPELKAEADSIMSALKSGGRWPDPSPYFADYFRPGAQPYLASLFARDIRSAFAAAATGRAALVAAGGADLQVTLRETELLADAAPGSVYRVVPGMSHALKGVGEDEEANYASFTDPSLPLAEGLVDIIAAFAKGAPVPGETPKSATSPASAPERETSLAPGTAPQDGEDLGEGVAR